MRDFKSLVMKKIVKDVGEKWTDREYFLALYGIMEALTIQSQHLSSLLEIEQFVSCKEDIANIPIDKMEPEDKGRIGAYVKNFMQVDMELAHVVDDLASFGVFKDLT